MKNFIQNVNNDKMYHMASHSIAVHNDEYSRHKGSIALVKQHLNRGNEMNQYQQGNINKPTQVSVEQNKFLLNITHRLDNIGGTSSKETFKHDKLNGM